LIGKKSALFTFYGISEKLLCGVQAAGHQSDSR